MAEPGNPSATGPAISATTGTLGQSDTHLGGTGHGGVPLEQSRDNEPQHRAAARAPFRGYNAKEETYRREIDAGAQDLEPELSWAEVQERHPAAAQGRDASASAYDRMQNQVWSQVSARPWLAVSIAAGVGLLLSNFYKNRSRRRS